MNAEYVNYHNVRIPMRDGITLGADVYLPDGPGPFPVHLSRSPYNGTATRQNTDCCQKGIALVWVDCRGRALSDGVCEPYYNEIDDGYDTLEWLSRQEWCNGRVIMTGGSYPAQTQLSAAASGHPALVGIAPSAIGITPYETYYTHGVLELAFQPPWHIGLGVKNMPPSAKPNWEQLRRELPNITLDERAGIPCRSWQEVARTPDPDTEFWQKKSLKTYIKNIKCPFFIQGSYFDLLGRVTPDIFTELMADPDTCEAFKKHSHVRIGPWGHGVNVQEGDYSYGRESLVTEDMELDFLEKCLAGEAPDCDNEPGRIQYFTMGENKWHYTDTWPVPGAVDTPFYFGSKGNANTLKGDGWLTRVKPEADTPADRFTYDPADPVPTCGGRMIGSGGQRCQDQIESRPDVLVYTSEILTADLNVTGMVKACLFVSSSAPDTDFTVKLVDVLPDGRPMNVCDTIYRMRYRNGFKNPEMMKNGEVYKVEFDVDYTSIVFLRGHRIRVEISSSNFPHYERNLNTEKLPALETEIRTADQTVYHGCRQASCIILPIL